jgi:hypothetical protein
MMATHCHLVFGQRAGLVGTDDGDRTQRLHGGHAPHDGPAGGHALHPRARVMVMMAGRPSGMAATAMPTAARNMSAAEKPWTSMPKARAKAGQGQDGDGEPLAEDRHLLEERGHDILDVRQHAADAADLGVVGAGHDHAPALAKDHQGAGVSHAGPVADGGLGGDRGRGFFHRFRFAREGRLLDAQVAGLDQAQVGGDLVSRRPAAPSRRAPGPRRRSPAAGPSRMTVALEREHVADGVQGLFGLALLDEANQGVDEHHAQDDAAYPPSPPAGR